MYSLADFIEDEDSCVVYLRRSKAALDSIKGEFEYAKNNNAPAKEIVRISCAIRAYTETVEHNKNALRNARIDLANYLQDLSNYAGQIKKEM